MSTFCDVCPLKRNNNCLHLHSCCTNKHINNLHNNQNNKDAHPMANTLLAHLTTRYFTFINLTNKHRTTPYHHVSSPVLATSHVASALHNYTPIYYASLEQHLWPNLHSHQTPTYKFNSLNSYTTTIDSPWKPQQET